MSHRSQRRAAPELSLLLETPYRPLEAGPFHIVTTVTAPEIASEEEERPPVNVSFVVDRSGSMAGGKLELVKAGVQHAFRLLNREDTFSLVVYDDRVDVITDQRAARRRYRADAANALSDVQPRGSTALAAGWASGCQLLAPLVDQGGEEQRPICRTLLLTDGLANVGESDPTALAGHASELKARGIATSTFGVGSQFDDVLLAGMADAGGGKYHYIPNAAAIPQVFAGELGELLATGARNVYLAVLVPAGGNVTNLNGLKEDSANRWVQASLGDLMSGEQRTITWRYELPATEHGALEKVALRLSWCDADGRPREVVEQSLDVEARSDPGRSEQAVLDEVALLRGAHAREEAVRMVRAGRADLARASIFQAREALPASPAGLAEASALDRIAADIDSADETTRKEWYYESRLRQRNQQDYRRTKR